MTNPLISAAGITIAYPNGLTALKDFTLDVAQGEFVGIVGPSGCGKTTFLDAVAGLMPVAGGRLTYKGKPISGINTGEVGYLFQKDSLMPWRTAAQNVYAALELRKVPQAEWRQRAQDILQKVGLGRFTDKYPAQLSGGMRRRVQLAVLLAFDPPVILMDEPFGALDAQTRTIIEDDFLRLWEQNRKTVLFVTHDLEEAICLCDKVVILTAHPGTRKQVLEVPLQRPRTIDEAKFDPEFPQTLKTLSTSLRAEVGRTLAL
ncbi:ABC transporter ATP-binding protein [Neorhizobium alkalisoli]|uniref:NitT/TauT family transport system ATP-binding protein n=1 Tax=Neorhizobium alkalisoli TaxID=528178 RepID=A0A561R9N6_9HYPH|nr:ABC transporter ATP-binding protein [Neorhizobium alkalisoli]TWF59319.1 NitT/TauT family transport system ATP-binding protein [Neorhizobium alkalisoli]